MMHNAIGLVEQRCGHLADPQPAAVAGQSPKRAPGRLWSGGGRLAAAAGRQQTQQQAALQRQKHQPAGEQQQYQQGKVLAEGRECQRRRVTVDSAGEPQQRQARERPQSFQHAGQRVQRNDDAEQRRQQRQGLMRLA
jgi:hypothetical protein